MPELTAVFQKVAGGYIGFVEELPGANTQGATLDEARAKSIGGKVVIREPLRLPA